MQLTQYILFSLFSTQTYIIKLIIFTKFLFLLINKYTFLNCIIHNLIYVIIIKSFSN